MLKNPELLVWTAHAVAAAAISPRARARGRLNPPRDRHRYEVFDLIDEPSAAIAWRRKSCRLDVEACDKFRADSNCVIIGQIGDACGGITLARVVRYGDVRAVSKNRQQ